MGGTGWEEKKKDGDDMGKREKFINSGLGVVSSLHYERWPSKKEMCLICQGRRGRGEWQLPSRARLPRTTLSTYRTARHSQRQPD